MTLSIQLIVGLLFFLLQIIRFSSLALGGPSTPIVDIVAAAILIITLPLILERIIVNIVPLL